MESSWDSTDLCQVVGGLVNSSIESMTSNRDDRLWPQDYSAFASTPLSLAFGACGTAVFLRRATGRLPRPAEDWLLGKSLAVDNLSPGLFAGLAGIALSFLELGWQEDACRLMSAASRSPLLFADVSLAIGISGWGFANLCFYASLRDSLFLDRATSAADFLQRTSTRSSEGTTWVGPSGERALGFGSGGAGIGLFLMQLYEATGDSQHLDLALDTMRAVVCMARSDHDALRWPARANEEFCSPFWIAGTSGVGAVLLRFARVLGDTDFLRLAKRAHAGCTLQLAGSASQFDGLAGVGEFLLDMYQETSENSFFEAARKLAARLHLFAVPWGSGVFFPGRRNLRLSADYAFGSAGAGMFLLRLMNPGPRFLVDTNIGHNEAPTRLIAEGQGDER